MLEDGSLGFTQLCVVDLFVCSNELDGFRQELQGNRISVVPFTRKQQSQNLIANSRCN